MARYEYDPDNGRGEQDKTKPKTPTPPPPKRGTGGHHGTNDDKVKKKKKKNPEQQQPKPDAGPSPERKRNVHHGSTQDRVGLSAAQRQRAKAQQQEAIHRAAVAARADAIATATRRWQRMVTETPTSGTPALDAKVAQIRQDAANAAAAQRQMIRAAQQVAESAARAAAAAHTAEERTIQQGNMRAARAASMAAYVDLIKKQKETERHIAWTAAIEKRRAAIATITGGQGGQRSVLKPLATKPAQGPVGKWTGVPRAVAPVTPVKPVGPVTTGTQVIDRVKTYDKKDHKRTGKALEGEMDVIRQAQDVSGGNDFDVNAYNEVLTAYSDYIDGVAAAGEKASAHVDTLTKAIEKAPNLKAKNAAIKIYNRYVTSNAYKSLHSELVRLYGHPDRKKEGSVVKFVEMTDKIVAKQDAFLNRAQWGDGLTGALSEANYQQEVAKIDETRGYVTTVGANGQPTQRQRTLQEEIDFRLGEQRQAERAAQAGTAHTLKMQIEAIQKDPAASAVSLILQRKGITQDQVSTAEWPHVANGLALELVGNWEKFHPLPVSNNEGQLNVGLPNEIPYYLENGGMDLMQRPAGMSDAEWGDRVRLLEQKGLLDPQQAKDFFATGAVSSNVGLTKISEWQKQRQAYEDEVRKYLDAPDPGLLGDIFSIPVVEGLVNALGGTWGALGVGHQQRAAAMGGVPGRGESGILGALASGWQFLEKMTNSKSIFSGVVDDVQKGNEDAKARGAAGDLIPMPGISQNVGIIGLPIDIINSLLGGDVVDVSPAGKAAAAEFLKQQALASKSGDIWEYLRFLNSDIPQNPIRFGPGAPLWNIGGMALVDPSNYIPLNVLGYMARGRHAVEATQKVTRLGEGVLARGYEIAKKAGVGVHTFVTVSDEFLKAKTELVKTVTAVTGLRSSVINAKLGEVLAGLTEIESRDAKVRHVLDALGLTQKQIEGTQLANLVESMVTEAAKHAGEDLITRADEIAADVAKKKAEEAARVAERKARTEAAKVAKEIRVATVEASIKQAEDVIKTVRDDIATKLSDEAARIAKMAHEGSIDAAERAAADLKAAVEKAAAEATDAAKVEAKRVADEAKRIADEAAAKAADVEKKRVAEEAKAAAEKARKDAETPAKARIKARDKPKTSDERHAERVGDRATGQPRTPAADVRRSKPIDTVVADPASAAAGKALAKAREELAKAKKLRSDLGNMPATAPEMLKVERLIQGATMKVKKATDDLAALTPEAESPALQVPRPRSGKAYVPGNDDVGSLDGSVRTMEQDLTRVTRSTHPATDEPNEIYWHPQSEARDSEEAAALRAQMEGSDPAVAVDARQRLRQMAHDERQDFMVSETIATRRAPQLTPAQFLRSAGAYGRAAQMSAMQISELVERVRNALRLSKGKGGLAKAQHRIGVSIENGVPKVIDEAKSAKTIEFDTRGELRAIQHTDEHGATWTEVVREGGEEVPADIPINLGEQATLFLITPAGVSDFYRPLTASGATRYRDARWLDWVRKMMPSDFISFIHSEAAEFATMNRGGKGPWAFSQSVQGLFELFHGTREKYLERMPALHDLAVKMVMQPSAFSMADDVEAQMLARLWLLMESRAGLPWALPYDVAEHLVADFAPKVDMIPSLTLSMFPGAHITSAGTTRFRLPPALERLRDTGSHFFGLPPVTWVGDSPFESQKAVVTKLFSAGRSTFYQYSQTATALITHHMTEHGQYMKAGSKFRAQVLENGLHRALRYVERSQKIGLKAFDDSPFVKDLYNEYVRIVAAKSRVRPMNYDDWLKQLKRTYAQADKYFPGKRVERASGEASYVDYGAIGSVGTSKPLREAFETLHTHGKVKMSSPGGEIMMFLTHNFQYPNDYLGGRFVNRANRFIERMATFGMGDEATEMVAEMFGDQYSLYARKASAAVAGADSYAEALALARDAINNPEGRFWVRTGKLRAEQIAGTWQDSSARAITEDISAELGMHNEEFVHSIDDLDVLNEEAVRSSRDYASSGLQQQSLTDLLEEHSAVINKVMLKKPKKWQSKAAYRKFMALTTFKTGEMSQLGDLMRRLGRMLENAPADPAFRSKVRKEYARIWNALSEAKRQELVDIYHVQTARAIKEITQDGHLPGMFERPSKISPEVRAELDANAARLAPGIPADPNPFPGAKPRFSQPDTKPSGFVGNPEHVADPEGLFRKPGSVPPRTDLQPVDGYPVPQSQLEEAAVAPVAPRQRSSSAEPAVQYHEYDLNVVIDVVDRRFPNKAAGQNYAHTYLSWVDGGRVGPMPTSTHANAEKIREVVDSWTNGVPADIAHAAAQPPVSAADHAAMPPARTDGLGREISDLQSRIVNLDKMIADRPDGPVVSWKKTRDDIANRLADLEARQAELDDMADAGGDTWSEMADVEMDLPDETPTFDETPFFDDPFAPPANAALPGEPEVIPPAPAPASAPHAIHPYVVKEFAERGFPSHVLGMFGGDTIRLLTTKIRGAYTALREADGVYDSVVMEDPRIGYYTTLSGNGIHAETDAGWNWRMPESRTGGGGEVDRFSISVRGEPNVINFMDEMVRREAGNMYYKTPPAGNWASRHDTITVYFRRPLTDADIAVYERGLGKYSFEPAVEQPGRGPSWLKVNTEPNNESITALLDAWETAVPGMKARLDADNFVKSVRTSHGVEYIMSAGQMASAQKVLDDLLAYVPGTPAGLPPVSAAPPPRAGAAAADPMADMWAAGGLPPAPPPRVPDPPRSAPAPDPHGEIGMLDDSEAAYEAKRLETLRNLSGMTDEEFFRHYRNELLSRRRHYAFSSPRYREMTDEIGRMNLVLRDMRRIKAAKKNIHTTPGKARRLHADDVVRQYGDEADVMFPERRVAYYATTQEQVKVEIARAAHRKIHSSVVKTGKKPRKWWNVHDPKNWTKLNKKMSDAIREVNGYAAGAVRARKDWEKMPTEASAPRWSDREANILAAKKRVLREWKAETGEDIRIWQYDLIRGVLEPATAPGRRASLLIRRGATTEEEFLKRRTILAKAEARKTLWQTAYENPDMAPDDVYRKFLDDWSDNGELRDKEQVITGFQQHMLKGYFKHLTGASYDDEIGSAAALSAHGTRPPFDLRYDFKAHQVRIGAWTPRTRDQIDQGRVAWSYDKQVDFFKANYRAVPDWLSDPAIADGSLFRDHATFARRLRSNGTYDSQALVESRLTKADSAMTAHTYAHGDPAKGIEPRRDLADQRRLAAETWGSRVVDDKGRFISMPWLMTPSELADYVKANVGADLGNLVWRAEEMADLQASIQKVIDRKFPTFLRTVADRGATDLTYSDVIEFAYEATQELMRTKSWRPFWRRDLIARGLDVWAMVWRAQVMTQIGFVTSNLIDNPSKGFVFSRNRAQIIERASSRGRAAIPNLEAIGQGDYTTLMYAGSRRSLKQRVADAREIGELGPGARDVADGVLNVLANGLGPIAGKAENAVKLRMAQDLYGGLWREFRDTVLKEMDDTAADLAIKLEVSRTLDRIFPTMRNAGQIERLINQFSPFLSYNIKNKVVWIREAAAHPGMLLRIRNAQRLLEKYNEDKWKEEHPGEPFPPPGWDRLKTQFPLGAPFGKDIWLDLGIFSDAGRGLSLLYAGDKPLADHLYSVFRPFSAMQISTFREVANGLGISVEGVTTQMKWVPVLNSDGEPSGQYERKVVPIGTEWGAEHLGWNDIFWPASIIGELNNLANGGKLEPHKILQMVARLTFFKEFGEVDQYAVLNMQYQSLKDMDPEAAKRFLLSPEGQMLKQYWLARGMLPKSHYVNPLLFENLNDLDPKTARTAFIATQGPDFMKRVKDGYSALHAMEDYYDQRMSTVPYGSDEWKRMKLERKVAALGIYKDFPELLDYESIGRTDAEWAQRQQRWAIDEAEDTFYKMYGKWPKRADFKTDKEYQDARKEFTKARDAYLAANPGVANRLYSTYSSLDSAESRVRAYWGRAFDRIGRRQKRIDALTEAGDYEEANRLYDLNELDRQLLEREGVAVMFDKASTTMIGGSLISRTAGRLGLVQDFENKRYQAMNPDERRAYRKERDYRNKMTEVRQRAKASGDFGATFYRIMKHNPDLREQWFDHTPGKREQWAQNDTYMNFWDRFHQLASRGRWDAAWNTFDNAPAWIRERYYAKNPTARHDHEMGSKYFGYMSRWGQLLDGKDIQKAFDYFDSLPQWVKDRYYAKHPDSKMRDFGNGKGGGLSDAQFKQYTDYMGKWVHVRETQGDAAAARYFSGIPQWARNFYTSRHKYSGKGGSSGGGGSSLSDSQFNQYTKMMGKWVGLLKTKGKEDANAYFRSLPKWAQDFYTSRHPDKALLTQNDAQLKKMAMFFASDEAHQNAMIQADPSILKWLHDNASGSQRYNAIMYLYASLPDDAWIKRTFREKYPEVFSPEAKGERAIQSVLDTLAENPKLQPAFLLALQNLWDEVAEAQKHQLAPPKQMEMDREKRRRLSHRHKSAADVANAASNQVDSPRVVA